MATPDLPSKKEGRKPPPPVKVSNGTPIDENDEEIDDEPARDPAPDADAELEQRLDDDTEVKPEKRSRKEIKAELLKGASKPTEPAPMIVQARREDQNLADWIGGIGGAGGLRIGVSRSAPRVFAGKNVKGHLETFDDFISEEIIREQFGGGSYQLRVLCRDKRGSWVYKASTTVDIAGDPRVDNLPKADPNAEVAGAAARAESSAGTDKVLAVLERTLEHERKREPHPTGPDMGAIAAFMRPLELQIKTMSEALAKKDEQLSVLASKPANPFQDQLLGQLIKDDTARVTAVRIAADTELRTVKENHTSEINRLTDRYEREKDGLIRQHDRQMADQKAAYERELANTKASFEREIAAKDLMFGMVKSADTSSAAVQKAQLESDNRRLERDIAELRIEVKDLRAKKDKGPIEMAKELEGFKEALGIGEDDGKEKGALEKFADMAFNSDKLFDLAGKWIGPKETAPQQGHPQQQQMMQQQPRIIRKNGQVFALANDGKYHPVRRRRRQDGAETEEFEEGLQIPPEQVAFATSVLERAFSNGTAPEKVAATISTALSPEILQAIRDHGVDGFLNKVAKLGAASPLRRQDGINWLRKLGKAILGDDPDAPDAAPAESEDDADLDDLLSP